MSKKISKDEFLSRFYFRYPQAKIEILKYTSISRPATIKCLKCGKILNRKIARQFLNGFDCCDSNNETRIDRLYHIYDGTDFDIVHIVDKDNVIVRHTVCGCEQHRNIVSCLDKPFFCRACNMREIDLIKDTQNQLDSIFGGEIILLEYRGQHAQNYYRCTRCGKIFKRKQDCVLKSNGCPVCNR